MAEFVADLRAHSVTAHVAQNITNRRSAIDAPTARHPGYAVSGWMLKRVEEIFGPPGFVKLVTAASAASAGC